MKTIFEFVAAFADGTEKKIGRASFSAAISDMQKVLDDSVLSPVKVALFEHRDGYCMPEPVNAEMFFSL